MKKRTLCIVTTSRADYGLLYWLMWEIKEDPDLCLQIIASGMHLSPEFGLTYRKIEQDGFQIDKKIEMLLSADSESSIVKSIAVGLPAFCDALEDLRPHILVILGDRFELFCPAISALVTRIPIAHIHGGETSQGAIDESVRHCITKLACLHFPATEIYRKRIIQMGENPDFVFNFGAPGLDHIYKETLLTKDELEEFLDFDLSAKTAMVTYHPVTLENTAALVQVQNVFQAIKALGIQAIFTKANADAHGREINRAIADFCASNPERYRLFDNLGQQIYLSCLKHLSLMVGNSSSGLTEGPSFKIPVVNIGNRQLGRIKAENIIDAGYGADEIQNAIARASSEDFKNHIKNIKNPYDRYEDGRVSLRIKDKLKEINLAQDLIKKRFYDHIL